MLLSALNGFVKDSPEPDREPEDIGEARGVQAFQWPVKLTEWCPDAQSKRCSRSSAAYSSSMREASGGPRHRYPASTSRLVTMVGRGEVCTYLLGLARLQALNAPCVSHLQKAKANSVGTLVKREAKRRKEQVGEVGQRAWGVAVPVIEGSSGTPLALAPTPWLR